MATDPQIASAASDMLEAFDNFMAAGAHQAEAERELYHAATLAGCFAAQAYEKAPGGGPDIHALTRAFLLALIDPSNEQLDHLRADPASGAVAREADARLRSLSAQPPSNGEEA